MINLPVLICAASLNCTHSGEIDLPFRYIEPYREGHACYIRGEFFTTCPDDIESYYKV